MGGLEIILLAAGAVIFIASFCVPIRKEKMIEEAAKVAESEIKSLAHREMENMRPRLAEISEEELQQQIEESERTMERISNEKIMAVNEYSDTVLDEIHKNHEEVVFLYDMLKDRKEKLTESLSTADRDIKELLQKVKDAEITVKEDLKACEEKHRELTEFQEELVKTKTDIEAAKKGLNGAKQDLTAVGMDSIPKQSAISVLQSAQSASVLSSGEKEAESVFMPFQPPKIEAVPKKAETEKPLRKRNAPSEDKMQKTVEEKRKAGKSEGADLEVLLTSEKGKSGGTNSNERILELHKAGKSNMAIAKELGLGIGEVKLVIDLFESWR